MRIAWISHSADRFGAELCLLEGVEELAQRGHEQLVVFPWGGPLAERVARTNAEVAFVPFPWWVHRRRERALGHALKLIPGVLRLCSRLRRFAPDVVVTNTVTIGAGAIAARLLSVPHVWYIHEFGQRDLRLRFDFGESFSHNLMSRLSDAVMFNSRSIADAYRHAIAPEKSIVLRFSIPVPDDNAVTAPDPPPFRALVLGRFEPRKAQEDAVRAVAALVRRGRAIALTLAGGGDADYAERLRETIRSLGVEREVTLREYVDDPFPMIAQSHVLLVCSPTEPFGRVTVEAMKVGTPVIGARAAGTAELVDDGVTGLLYTTHDTEELAEKIDRLYADPALRERLREAAHRWAWATFNSEGYARGLLEAVRRATAKSR